MKTSESKDEILELDEVFDLKQLQAEFKRLGYKPPHRNQFYKLEKKNLFPRRHRISPLPRSRMYWTKPQVAEFFQLCQQRKVWHPQKAK